jgi:hypothetical protein
VITGTTITQTDPSARYIELMKRCLLGLIYEDPTMGPNPLPFDPVHRELGLVWPMKAHSMVGTRRMENLRDAILHVLGKNIPGDFIETGVWRGGACIFMRAVLGIYGVTDRNVWVADSFEGLPPVNAALYPADAAGVDLSKYHELAVSLDEVKANFAKYDLLDDQVRFLKGWFKDTLHSAPIGRLAILRLDGDMYESTMDALVALYDKVSPGGVVIVDDYGAISACRQAVHDFRDRRGINDAVCKIVLSGVFWVKTARNPERVSAIPAFFSSNSNAVSAAGDRLHSSWLAVPPG